MSLGSWTLSTIPRISPKFRVDRDDKFRPSGKIVRTSATEENDPAVNNVFLFWATGERVRVKHRWKLYSEENRLIYLEFYNDSRRNAFQDPTMMTEFATAWTQILQNYDRDPIFYAATFWRYFSFTSSTFSW